MRHAPGVPETCPNLNSKLANMIAEPVEPTAGPTANLQTVAVVPNPFRGRESWDRPDGNEVHFINLPAQARIRIYTVAGDLVRELNHNDPVRDFERWDLKNANGRDVASGIYMYRVEAGLLHRPESLRRHSLSLAGPVEAPGTTGAAAGRRSCPRPRRFPPAPPCGPRRRAAPGRVSWTCPGGPGRGRREAAGGGARRDGSRGADGVVRGAGPRRAAAGRCAWPRRPRALRSGRGGREAGRAAPAAVLSAAGAEPVSAWVTFGDKGETGAGDLVRRLAEAEAALDPHARARRERAGVTPLVDYLDLPVHPPYLESLRALGLAPYGTSRWFNRVAVRATGGATGGAGRTVLRGARLAPVERAERMRDAPAGPRRRSARGGAGLGRAATALDYGLTAAQLAQIGVPALHDSGYTGAGVRICVLDDGFNYYATHPALQDADVLATRDFVRGVDDPTDLAAPTRCFRHGTETFSCIAGNQPGRYVGAAPGATFLLGRTEYTPTETPVEMVYWGMGAEWADSAGADIISSSLGYMTFDATPPTRTTPTPTWTATPPWSAARPRSPPARASWS